MTSYCPYCGVPSPPPMVRFVGGPCNGEQHYLPADDRVERFASVAVDEEGFNYEVYYRLDRATMTARFEEPNK